MADQAAINKLKILKRVHSGHLTRAMNSLETELADKVDPNGVSKYLESVNIKFQKVQEDSMKLLEHYVEEGDIDKEVTEVDDLENKVIDIKTRAQAALDCIKEIREEEKRKKAKAEAANPDPPPPREERPRAPKLPDLQIEKFSGDLEKYQEFIDAFNATIDNNPKLEDVDKFRYLRMYLDDSQEGDGPKSLIAGFSTTSGNYKEALKLIKETYGKRKNNNDSR